MSAQESITSQATRLRQLQWPTRPIIIKPFDLDLKAVLDALALLVFVFHLDFENQVMSEFQRDLLLSLA